MFKIKALQLENIYNLFYVPVFSMTSHFSEYHQSFI